jgi:hypothetical protein
MNNDHPQLAGRYLTKWKFYIPNTHWEMMDEMLAYLREQGINGATSYEATGWYRTNNGVFFREKVVVIEIWDTYDGKGSDDIEMSLDYRQTMQFVFELGTKHGQEAMLVECADAGHLIMMGDFGPNGIVDPDGDNPKQNTAGSHGDCDECNDREGDYYFTGPFKGRNLCEGCAERLWPGPDPNRV